MAACHYCGTAPGDTRDHIIPRSKGGPTDRWNIVAACAKCNHRKGDTYPPKCRCAKCKQAMWKFTRMMRGSLD